VCYRCCSLQSIAARAVSLPVLLRALLTATGLAERLLSLLHQKGAQLQVHGALELQLQSTNGAPLPHGIASRTRTSCFLAGALQTACAPCRQGAYPKCRRLYTPCRVGCAASPLSPAVPHPSAAAALAHPDSATHNCSIPARAQRVGTAQGRGSQLAPEHQGGQGRRPLLNISGAGGHASHRDAVCL